MVSSRISKQDFIGVIENLRRQYFQDREYVDGLSLLYGIDIPFYDNKPLMDSIIVMLRLFFPKDVNGFCEIEHFCYVCEFGKVGDVKDADELWGVLVGGVKSE